MDTRRRNLLSSFKTSSGGTTTSGSYTVNLNGQWELTTTPANPDSTLYDGVYRSTSNYTVNNGVATMYITIKDCSSFKIYIRSYAESNYDYVMVSQLDQTIDGNTSYSNTTLVKAHTRGNQQSGTALSYYTLVEYTGITSGEHTITVIYRKDSSAHSGDDRGYVLIPKSQSGGGEGSDEWLIDIDNYLTIEALENGLTAKLSTNACEYCINGDGVWYTLGADTITPSINQGQVISFRGYLTPSSSKGIGTFTISKKCNLKGNSMSMLFGDNAGNKYSLSGKDYAFGKLFQSCTNIIEVSHNFLPATTLASNCYYHMFAYCTSLTTAPELPATTLVSNCYDFMFGYCKSLTTAPELSSTALANYCYSSMFSGCTSLTTAPELPATTLTDYCYNTMFSGCTSLVTTPELSSTALANYCYSGMFSGCTSLTTVPELPATTLANYCYSTMFNGCTSLTAAPELLATTLVDSCYRGMFSGCTSLTTAPELPATTLYRDCYSSMFSGCTSLTTAPELPATTLAYSCYQFMFENCTSLTTVPELPAIKLTGRCYESMFQNCSKLNYIKAMFTTTPNNSYTKYWVKGVSSTGTFVKNKVAMWNVTGDNGIPSGWTVVKV